MMKKKTLSVIFVLFGIFSNTSNGAISNVALKKPTSQSSTYNAFGSNLAVDGLDGRTPSTGSCGQTLASGPKPWWEVNLLNDFLITSVAITTPDADPPELIHDFYIQVYNSGQTIHQARLCYYHNSTTTRATTQLYLCSQTMRGRRVRITINGVAGTNETLVLCEVYVFGGTEAIVSPSIYQKYKNIEISSSPDMTYMVLGYSTCAMKCYMSPYCRVFSITQEMDRFRCDIFMTSNPFLKGNSTLNWNPTSLTFIMTSQIEKLPLPVNPLDDD